MVVCSSVPMSQPILRSRPASLLEFRSSARRGCAQLAMCCERSLSIPTAQLPRVVLRWGDARDLLVSGLLDGGDEIAQHAAVIDSPLEKGHLVLFSLNPFWRGQTSGSYSLVFNAILNFDSLNAGRKLDEK